MRQRGARHRPAVAEIADPVAVRHAGVVDEHFTESTEAVHLPYRPDLDARLDHVDDEVADAPSTRRRRVRACEEQAPPGHVRVRAPDLLTGDRPAVSRLHRLRPEAGQIGAGTRFAEQLAPRLLPP